MKRINYIQLVTALFMAFFLSQCYYDQILYEPAEPAVQGDVSFRGDIIPIFNSSCSLSGCHITGSVSPDLTEANAYNSLIGGKLINTEVPESSELYQWMSGRRSMPMPVGGSNPSYNATVLQWIRQGAKNN